MKQFLITVAALLLFSAAWGADVDALKQANLDGTKVKASVMEKKFDSAAWQSDGNTVVFSGTVRAGSVFDPKIKESFLDVSYTTIEELNFQARLNFICSQYPALMTDDVKKKAGFNKATLLSSEIYYNTMEILDADAVGSKVSIRLSLKNGKAVIDSFSAPKFYIFNENKETLLNYLEQ